MGDQNKVPLRARGGSARAQSMSPEERRESARKAAAARWGGVVKKATHGSDDHPLKIGGIEIPCYVLEGGIRVLSQRGLQTGLGMSIGGSSRPGEQRMVGFVRGLEQRGLDIKDLASRMSEPIRFALTGSGAIGYGYEATILADLCDAILEARKRGGILLPQQSRIAEHCEILVRGFARVGIIALIDEATGYQADRARGDLERILEQFIAKELQPYIPTFSSDYYNEMFRLRGLSFPNDTVKRPQYFGILTNDIIYKRLAPGVLEELKKVTPKNINGKNKAKLFQSLTSNKGYPKLREHLGRVIGTMENSKDWADFKSKLDRKYPRYDVPTQYLLDLADDDGVGL
jgi:P63C domain